MSIDKLIGAIADPTQREMLINQLAEAGIEPPPIDDIENFKQQFAPVQPQVPQAQAQPQQPQIQVPQPAPPVRPQANVKANPASAPVRRN